MTDKDLKPETDWRALTIYQIMVSSFEHSPEGAEGYDSMWGPSGERKDGNLQATGYFANDYFSIDPHFGTEDDLRELVAKAHERGLYVFLDGVLGHHGGVDKPSAIYWIDKFEIDGWRFDQAYQLCQNGHNYWCEISDAVREVCDRRRADGKQWGTLGYMVGEDWSDAGGIISRIFRDGGLKSAFDFDGKLLIGGEMNGEDGGGLEHGWDDVMKVYSSPADRGYQPADVLPNLFLSNHDGVRVADSFYDNGDEVNLMTRFAILAGYPGPVTIYYGDEFADLSRDCADAQPDNASRTTGHLKPDDDRERRLFNYVCDAMTFRHDNPAMWRGTMQFDRYKKDDAEILVVVKTDTETDNRVAMIFSDRDTETRRVRGYVPELIKLA